MGAGVSDAVGEDWDWGASDDDGGGSSVLHDVALRQGGMWTYLEMKELQM